MQTQRIPWFPFHPQTHRTHAGRVEFSLTSEHKFTSQQVGGCNTMHKRLLQMEALLTTIGHASDTCKCIDKNRWWDSEDMKFPIQVNTLTLWSLTLLPHFSINYIGRISNCTSSKMTNQIQTNPFSHFQVVSHWNITLGSYICTRTATYN